MLSAEIVKQPKTLKDSQVRVDMRLGPDTLRVILRINGEFTIEAKTGLGSAWRKVGAGNVGDGECAACGGTHVRSECR